MSYESMAKDLAKLMGNPVDSFTKLLSLSKAVITGDRGVSEQRREARLAICLKCPLANKTHDPPICSICGCKLKGEKSVVNLIAYEETKDYGCKHPSGSRWKEAGV